MELSKKYYLVQYEEFIPKILKEVAADIPYWPSSPSSGGGFRDTNSLNEGDIHNWDCWHGNKPIHHYRNLTPRFLSEFGFQSFPDYNTIKAFSHEEENIFSYMMEEHQKNPTGNQKIMYYIGELFLAPKDFQATIYLSQLMQAEAMRIAVEHLRSNYPRSTGSLYWQLNDCWPVTSWSTLDYYHYYKAAHYFAKRFYAPALLILKEDNEKRLIEVYLSNDEKTKKTGKYYWGLINLNGEVLEEGVNDYSVGGYSTSKIGNLKFKLKEEDCFNKIIVVRAYDKTGEMYEAFTSFVPYKYLKLEKANIKPTLSKHGNKYSLILSTDKVVLFLRVQIKNKNIVLSDNYVYLCPKESKIIFWDCPEKIKLEDIEIYSLVDSY